jgi:hypothetical protein
MEERVGFCLLDTYGMVSREVVLGHVGLGEKGKGEEGLVVEPYTERNIGYLMKGSSRTSKFRDPEIDVRRNRLGGPL